MQKQGLTIFVESATAISFVQTGITYREEVEGIDKLIYGLAKGMRKKETLEVMMNKNLLTHSMILVK